MSRTILITGATSGIGRATALALAHAGARVIVHGRSARRVRDTVRTLTREAGRPMPDGIVADLARRRDLRILADTLLARDEALHVLIHNAAVVPPELERTEDGLELQFAVNHLAPFILTLRLLPLLRRHAPARIVIVASQLERDGRPDLDDPISPPEYRSGQVYADTKLANVLFMRALARRLAGSGVTANALHPGIAGTNLLHALAGKPRWTAAWTRYQQPAPDTIAANVAFLALDPALAGTSGAWFMERTKGEPSARARDDALAERLWARSLELADLPAELRV
jgi:NAD(P)-dependent dehydrogenase (short-subunit alcohol dehydrogenase family)